MNDIRRKYNPMVDLSKFTFNKKKLSKIVANFVAKSYHFFNMTRIVIRPTTRLPCH